MLCSNEQGEVLCQMEVGGSCMISCVRKHRMKREIISELETVK